MGFQASYRHSSGRFGHQLGFTLVELMVVLAIVAVLIFVATPNYDSVMVESRLDQERLSLATGLALARSEAVERGEAVRLCPHAGCGINETFNAGSPVEWLAGWRVEVANGGELIRQTRKQTADLTIKYNCGNVLAFSGSSERASSSGHAGECTFTVEDPDHPGITKSLAVSQVGRTRLF